MNQKVGFAISLLLVLMYSIAVADDLSLTETLVGQKTPSFLTSTSANKPEASDVSQNKSCEGLRQSAQSSTAVTAGETDSCLSSVVRVDAGVGDKAQAPGIRRDLPDPSIRRREIDRTESLNSRRPDGGLQGALFYPGGGAYPGMDWRSEFQDVLGYENYDRLAAAYVTVKKFDQWIDATLEGYGLGQANRLIYTQLTGVNQKLNAVLFSVWEPANGISAVDQPSGFQTNFDSKQLQEFTKQEAMQRSLVDSQVLVFMQYLTLINGLYAFLVFLGGYSMLKAVRFLLKQDLSD